MFRCAQLSKPIYYLDISANHRSVGCHSTDSVSTHHYLSLSSVLTSMLQEVSTGNMVIFGGPPASSISIVSSPNSFLRHSSWSSENMDSKSGEVIGVAMSAGCLSFDNFSEVGSGVTCKVVDSVAVGCGFAGEFSGSEDVALGVNCELAGLFALGCGVTCKPAA